MSLKTSYANLKETTKQIYPNVGYVVEKYILIIFFTIKYYVLLSYTRREMKMFKTHNNIINWIVFV